jgi:eukaryotic-like serine/threonine-protein kinase
MTMHDETLSHLQRVLREPDAANGRYRLLELVGQGGMGAVYRAHDISLDRDVALKVLRGDLANPGHAARLEREARILARLEHPGIVPVHDAGVLADGRVFYVMKLVRGERLERWAVAAPLSERLRLFLRICEAVGFAHAHGVVHRDLKPSNIMVGQFGEVLLLDWGIARVLHTADDEDLGTRPSGMPDISATDTAPGTVLGTPGFMAPEQARGQPHLVDGRTDVYALGAILRMLASRDGDQRPPRPLLAIATRALAPEPGDRYQSAEELAAEVTRFLDGEPVQVHRETWGERAGRIFRKYQTPIILVMTYLIIRLLFLATRGF